MTASSNLSGEAIKMASDVVQALENFHFASVALFAIATVLERVQKISANDRDCLELINVMLDLAKSIKQLTDINFQYTQRGVEKMTEAVHVICIGAIMCRSFLESKKIWKFLLTTKIREELLRLWSKVDRINRDLMMQIMISSYSLTSSNIFTQPPFSVHEGLPEGLRPMEITEATEEDDDGMERRPQLELGAPVQNLILPQSGGVVVTNSNNRRPYEQPRPLHMFFKLLKKISPKLGAIELGRNERNRDMGHETDLELDELFAQGPRRFSLAELAAATGNFSHDYKLGQGGFGDVYRGVLTGTNEDIAVKRISQWSMQSWKEYVSEVTIMRKLRHRNVVQLLGWCHEKGECLLVYEFLPNGGLDKHLHCQHNGTIHLSWEKRYSIACDVASALVYLHEDLDERVVHRDVKPSNVLLTSNLTAKLSDFGFARVVTGAFETFEVAGTFGYMAPECWITGEVSPTLDVFSFGALALEIACGKRPVHMTSTEHYCTVYWVWDLYEQGKILEAADEKLDGKFKAEEMERLMAVGLLCSHPDPNARPAMREVLKILKFEAELPYVPLNLPIAVYNDPFHAALIISLIRQ